MRGSTLSRWLYGIYDHFGICLIHSGKCIDTSESAPQLDHSAPLVPDAFLYQEGNGPQEYTGKTKCRE